MRDSQVNLNKDQGGYAFPSENKTQYIHGMSMRDYFAAAALTGMIQTVNETGGKLAADIYLQVVAEGAYTIADAMIKERNRT